MPEKPAETLTVTADDGERSKVLKDLPDNVDHLANVEHHHGSDLEQN